MRFSSICFLFALSSMTLSQTQSGSSAIGRSSTDAPEVTSNSNAFIARFKDKKGIHGTVGFSAKGMTPVRVNVQLRGLPDGKGPFTYHIHENQVPANSDCNGTGGHLDPYGRGEDPPCNAEDPSSCQVGDLAGKHGSLQGPQDTQNYLDRYLSLTQGNPAYVGGHSVVIHSSDGTRIACANIELKQASGDAGAGSGFNSNDNSSSSNPKETCFQTPCVRGIPQVTHREGQANKTKYVPKIQQLHSITNAHLHHPNSSCSSGQTKQTQQQTQHSSKKHPPLHSPTKTKTKAIAHSATSTSKPQHPRTRHTATKTKTKHRLTHSHTRTRTATHSLHRTAPSPPSMTSTGPIAQLPTDSTAQTSATPSIGPFSEGSPMKNMFAWRVRGWGYGVEMTGMAIALLAGVVWIL